MKKRLILYTDENKARSLWMYGPSEFDNTWKIVTDDDFDYNFMSESHHMINQELDTSEELVSAAKLLLSSHGRKSVIDWRGRINNHVANILQILGIIFLTFVIIPWVGIIIIDFIKSFWDDNNRFDWSDITSSDISAAVIYLPLADITCLPFPRIHNTIYER